jgi:hypothetical protein
VSGSYKSRTSSEPNTVKVSSIKAVTRSYKSRTSSEPNTVKVSSIKAVPDTALIEETFTVLGSENFLLL